MKTWEAFRAGIQRLKAERWIDALAAEPPGRAPGRRPRDPEKEALLTELDRIRVERSPLLRNARKIPARRERR